MNLAELKAIVATIQYRDWQFHVMEKGDGFLLQAKFMAPDAEKPGSEPVLQSCRKWYISSHAVTAEVVRTAMKAVEAAVIHEAQEEFKYRGVAIYSPHIDPDAAAEAGLPKGTRETPKKREGRTWQPARISSGFGD